MGAAQVADVAAAVGGGIGVEDFAVEAGLGDADAIIFADYGREIRDDDQEIFVVVTRAAHETQYAVFGVSAIEPLETLPLEIDLVQSGLALAERIEIGHQSLHTLVRRVIEKIPIEAGVVIPFFALREFAAHEEKFFSGMRVHVAEEQTEIGELLPVIAGHFVQQGSFTVDHFVVRKREHEIFGEGVEHGKVMRLCWNLR